MKMYFFVFTYFLSILGMAQTIEIEGKEYTWSDLAHPNRGCPENSTCSKPMGQKILKFKNFLQINKNKKNFPSLLENFRKKEGLPIQFLMMGENIGLDPVIWDSRCALHRNKDKSKAIVKAMQFFHNNPKSELVVLDGAWIGDEKYEVPYESGPILIDRDEIVIATEFDDTYFYMSISPKGKWKVINLDSQDIQKALSVREDTACAENEKRSLKTPFYAKTYCKKIWDRTLKKERVITLSWSCP